MDKAADSAIHTPEHFVWRHNRILVICFDNIGDLVFTSPIYPQLKAAFPAVTIDLLCKEYTRNIAELLPAVDKIYAADPFWTKSPGRGRGKFFFFGRTVRRLRKESYDCALIPNHCYRSALLALTLGIHRRLGFAKGKNRLLLTDRLPELRADRPIVAQLSQITTLLGAPAQATAYQLSREPLRGVELLHQPPKDFVLLHPFAGSPTRCASLAQWQVFAHRVKEAGHQVIWFGSAKELASLRASIPDIAEHECARYYSGGDFRSDLSLMTRCKSYVGHDSGPLHVAGGLGAKVFGVYVNIEPTRTGPQGLRPAFIYHNSSRDDVDPNEWFAAWSRFVSSVP